MTTSATPTSEPYVRVVEGYCPSLPDIPIYIHRSRKDAEEKFRKGFKRYRVTVIVEEIPE